MKYKKGIIIGKFMPLHKGHEYMIRFAKEYCEELTVVVDCLKEQTISPELRKKWIEDAIPNVKVFALNKYMPQDPSETKDFWNIWKETLLSVNGKQDVLIASMEYGFELAKHLNTKLIINDVERESVSISATQIRNNPFECWDFLSDSCKGYFLKKLCFLGPESTGKSTITKKLANEYNTVYIPEYAKTIIKYQNGEIYEKNLNEIALGQIRNEKALEKMTNKIMMCDSDIITTIVWSEVLFNKVPHQLFEIAEKQHYDTSFLFYPDTQWFKDEHRNEKHNNNEFRINMYNRMKYYLEKYNRNYIEVFGDFQEKEEFCKTYINKMFLNKSSVSFLQHKTF